MNCCEYQWVETNLSNFCIYPTYICLLPPHGTMLMAIWMLNTDVCRCQIGLFPPNLVNTTPEPYFLKSLIGFDRTDLDPEEDPRSDVERDLHLRFAEKLGRGETFSKMCSQSFCQFFWLCGFRAEVQNEEGLMRLYSVH